MKKVHINKKSVLILFGILLPTCMFIFKNFLFGNQVLAYADIGSDTYDQYLPFYQSLIHHIRQGNFSLWDFYNGYGTNMYIMNMFDPFLDMIYLWGVVFGAKHIYSFLVYWMILHILLSAVSLYFFLSVFSLSEYAKIIASCTYALCGYMVVWGQHYQFGTVMILFPLMLMSVEYSFHSRKWHLGISAICALASLSSLYTAYMQLLVLGFYVLFRVSWEKKLFSVDGIISVGKIYGFMLLGIGMGLIQLVPSAYYIAKISGRVSGESFLQRVVSMVTTLYSKEYYKVLGLRLFSSNILGVQMNDYQGFANYYEDPNVFLSALFIIAFVQFCCMIFTKQFTKKQKGLLVLTFVAFSFVLLVPLGSATFNGFAYPFSRHVFICMPFAVWMMAYVLDRIFQEKKCNLPLLAISSILILYVYLTSYLKTGKQLQMLLAALTAGMFFSILGYLIFNNQALRKLFPGVLAVCLVVSMASDAYRSYDKYRITLEKNGSEYMDELFNVNVQQALEYLDSIDDTFYRVEKDYTVGTDSSCLNAMIQGYRGISTYNSTLNTNIKEFLLNAWSSTMVANEAHFSFANASNEDLPASLSNVKYVLSKNPKFATLGYVLLKQFGDIYIYENVNTKDIAKFYPDTVTTETYQEVVSEGNKQQLLSNYLVCDSAESFQVEKENLNLSEKVLVADGNDIMIDRTERSLYLDFSNVNHSINKKYVMEFDISCTSGAKDIMISSNAGDTFFNINTDTKHISFTLPVTWNDIEICTLPGVTMEDIQISNLFMFECEITDLSALSEGIAFKNTEKDSRLTGFANVSQSGVLMIAIPYEDGWHAYVDGKEREILKVDFGFSGIALESGEHVIELRYKCPGFALGACGSMIFLLCTIVVWIRINKKEEKI